MPVSADAFTFSSVMELAMRSARSGSVAASAPATRLSADFFKDLFAGTSTLGTIYGSAQAARQDESQVLDRLGELLGEQ
jgi:hypothetical protein